MIKLNTTKHNVRALTLCVVTQTSNRWQIRKPNEICVLQSPKSNISPHILSLIINTVFQISVLCEQDSDKRSTIFE